MQYNLGAIGTGHWFERLYTGMKESKKISVTKAAGINSAESKLERLRRMGLDKNYYRFSENSPIPKEFFENLDIVHISDPNEYHASQTIQSLGEGKITVTEKTWGINKEEFYKVLNYINAEGKENGAYLHLHYVHKILTMELEGLLEKYTQKYGKVKAVSATFFETTSEGDSRRKGWLFSMNNGGLFMDWIHPFEILYCGAKAEKMELIDIEPYLVQKEYDTSNPTGIHAEVGVAGKFFNNATAFIRIAKGASAEKKSVRFVFESGSYLDLNYIDSEIEFNSENRGSWSLYEKGNLVEEGFPKGPTTSQILVNDMVAMCEGRKAGLSIEDATKLFEPQWKYQKLIKEKELRATPREAERFIKCGMTLSVESCILAF